MNKPEQLLKNIKKNLPALNKLLNEVNDMWNYEDLVYRFYHQSYKVYNVQQLTKIIVDTLVDLSPETFTANEIFFEIFKDGCKGSFQWHNKKCTTIKHTRPQIEAFFHSKFFLEMAVKYGKELEKAPEILPSGWAALLYFYNLRY